MVAAAVGYTSDMDVRRATFAVAVRLAIALSIGAATVAALLEAVGDVSRPSLVMSVIVVGFVTSWVHTGRAAAEVERSRRHRLATVPLSRPLV